MQFYVCMPPYSPAIVVLSCLEEIWVNFFWIDLWVFKYETGVYLYGSEPVEPVNAVTFYSIDSL